MIRVGRSTILPSPAPVKTNMNWQAETRIVRPDNQHKAKRTITFEAPDRETAEAMIPAEVKRNGYSGYELLKVMKLEQI